MANHVLLNSIDHQALKVRTERSAELGDNLWFSLTFPEEFRAVQAYYPIFFQKDSETGEFYPVAVFGFEDQENLFLSENGWDAGYIPLSVLRHPFLIGTQNYTEDGVEKSQRVLTIDLDNPRVNTEQGEALFLEFGGNTDYLDQIADMLETLHHGVVDNKTFVELLLANDLIESVNLELQLNDGSKHQMIGFYTINEDKLKALDANTLKQLHNNGYLQAIYMMIASQLNVRNLLVRKNQKLGL